MPCKVSSLRHHRNSIHKQMDPCSARSSMRASMRIEAICLEIEALKETVTAPCPVDAGKPTGVAMRQYVPVRPRFAGNLRITTTP